MGRPTIRAMIAAVLSTSLAGCGGGGGGGSAGVAVSVSPPAASVIATQQKTFSATVSGTSNQTVGWSVEEGTSGGTVDANGLYTAPNAAGTYHVVATSSADATKSATAIVTVTIGTTISPSSATLTLREQKTFAATVVGTSNSTVVWSVQEGAAGGSVSQAGVYTAPAAAGIYHIVATSSADSTKSAVATVTVQAGSATGTIQ